MGAIASPGDAYQQFGQVPAAWWAGALGGPSVALPDGRSLFLFGQTYVDDTLEGFGGQDRPNSALILDAHGVRLLPGQPIPDSADGVHYGPIGAAMLSDGTVLVCCEGLSDTGTRVATAACILTLTGAGVTFDHWITGWPNTTSVSDTVAPQVMYHCPVVVPAQNGYPETLVVFGTQYMTDGAVLWYATVPTSDIESYEQWTFATTSFGFPECDITASAWYDETGFHVVSVQESLFNQAVLYEAPTVTGPWERTLWVEFGPADVGEQRRRCYVHPQISVGDQQVLYSVARIWEEAVDPILHKPYWGVGAMVGLNVTLGSPLLISGNGVQPTGKGYLVLSGPGVISQGDGTLLLTDTSGDDTPITNNVGYSITQLPSGVYQIIDSSGALMTSDQGRKAILQGFTVVTNPDGTATVYTPSSLA